MKKKWFLLLYLISGYLLYSMTYTKEEITIRYRQGDEKIVQQIAEPFHHNIVRFQKSIGLYTVLPVKLEIIGEEKVSEQAIVEFSDAFYHFQRQTIYIRNPQKASRYMRLQQILLHEYIHHFIYHYFPNAPLWFHEGMAVYFSEGMSYQRKIHFVTDKLLGNSLTLAEMTRTYPEKRIQWQSFYSKSALAIQYLITHQKESFYQFWEQTSLTNDFDKAFITVFFMTPTHFSHHFEEFGNKHFRMELLLASSTLIWGFFPLLFIIGLVRQKWRERKILEQWQKKEQYEGI